MLIYRLEINGVGPYRDFNSDATWYQDMLIDHRNGHTHPSVYDDITNWCDLNRNYDYYCGFNTKEKLIKWFGCYLFGFNSISAEIVTYESNEVITTNSGKQIVFKLSDATLLKRKPILDWVVDNCIGLNKLIKLKRLCNRQFNFLNTPLEIFLHYELVVDADVILDKLNYLNDNGLSNIKTAGDCMKTILLINEIERVNN